MTVVARTDRDEIARLRSIIHRAWAQATSYNLREAIIILDEITADEDEEGDGLAQLCPTCQGDGLDPSHDGALYYAHTGDLPMCPTCGGYGEVTDDPEGLS